MLLFAILSIGRTEPNVSLGSHPVVANAGSLSANATAEPFTTPSDQMLLITDIIISTNPHSNCSSEITLTLSTGDGLGHFWVGAQRSGSNNNYGPLSYSTVPTLIQHNFTSGLPIPISDTLTITNSGNCSVAYTLSGHYVQP